MKTVPERGPGKPHPAVSFPIGAHEALRSIRGGHFWFESRRWALQDVLGNLLLPADSLVLEAGCGDGHLLSILPGSLVIGVDANLDDVILARRGWPGPLVVALAEQLPFRTQFGLICAFDLLEHLTDESPFLTGCRKALMENGRLVITVPSGPELWSRMDEYAGHCRRYTRKALTEVLEKTGLTIERIFPLFRMLRPLAWINAKMGSRKPITHPAAVYSAPRVANGALRFLLALEWRLFRQSSWGEGSSWCAVARK